MKPISTARLLVLFSILLLLLQVPFSAQASYKNPKSLTPVSDGARYVLASPYIFRSVVMGMQGEITLGAGSYTVMYRDKHGEYLLVDEENFRLMLESKKEGNPPIHFHKMSVAGIYLPKDPAVGARIFIVTPGGEDHTRASKSVVEAPRANFVPVQPSVPAAIGFPIANSIINAMIRIGEGKFKFMKGIEHDHALRQLLDLKPQSADGAAQKP